MSRDASCLKSGVSSGQRPGMLLDVPHLVLDVHGRAPTAKEDPAAGIGRDQTAEEMQKQGARLAC